MYSNRKNLTPSELLLRFDELEAVFRSPGEDDSLDKAQALAMYIARSAPNGSVANLAMQVMSAAIRMSNGNALAKGTLEATLAKLQTALKEVS